jgi:hypothetical protein
MLSERIWIYGIWIVALLGKQRTESATGDFGYKIDKYDESPGIYYENLGEATLYNTEWKTVVYANLKNTDQESERLGQYINHVNKLCHTAEIKKLDRLQSFLRNSQR